MYLMSVRYQIRVLKYSHVLLDLFINIIVNIVRVLNSYLGMEDQFKKYSTNEINSLGSPYDYGSVMHYGPYSFSRDRNSKILFKTFLCCHILQLEIGFIFSLLLVFLIWYHSCILNTFNKLINK